MDRMRMIPGDAEAEAASQPRPTAPAADEMTVEVWHPESEIEDPVPGAAYDRLRAQLKRADLLLRAIRDGKHSLPGTLVQIDRYFDRHGRDETVAKTERDAR